MNTKHSQGLNVREYWIHLFLLNEQAYKDGRVADILIDHEITMAMYEAFPDRTESKIFKQVPRARATYNRGDLTGGIRPKIQSYRYRRLKDGRTIRSTARGRVIGD